MNTDELAHLRNDVAGLRVEPPLKVRPNNDEVSRLLHPQRPPHGWRVPVPHDTIDVVLGAHAARSVFKSLDSSTTARARVTRIMPLPIARGASGSTGWVMAAVEPQRNVESWLDMNLL